MYTCKYFQLHRALIYERLKHTLHTINRGKARCVKARCALYVPAVGTLALFLLCAADLRRKDARLERKQGKTFRVLKISATVSRRGSAGCVHMAVTILHKCGRAAGFGGGFADEPWTIKGRWPLLFALLCTTGKTWSRDQSPWTIFNSTYLNSPALRHGCSSVWVVRMQQGRGPSRGGS